jgi:hypothetical protein
MNRSLAVFLAAFLALLALPLIGRAEKPLPEFKKITLSDKFYCEGANYGDFNKDGKLDVAAGPYWYEGPDFQKKHEIYPPVAFDPHHYSNNFLTFTGDFNGDGWLDVLYVPFPGTDAYWYENPGRSGGPWKKHLAVHDCGNESPAWADLIGQGRPQLIYCTSSKSGGHLGYATWDPAKPNDPWVFHPITLKDSRYQRFTHGLGVGDINGDGRKDVVEASGWWEQPARLEEGKPWIKHPFKFAEAGAQMAVYDVDGDGLADIITAWHCHQYGMVWYQQQRNGAPGTPGRGEISWKQHVILPPQPDLKSGALRISQMHSLDLADIRGDGLKGFVTGKRYWAHGPEGDKEPAAPAVLYWFELRRDKQAGVQFIPHMIDDNSGVGTQVIAKDLNGDGVPDIIVGNKKGVFVFLSQGRFRTPASLSDW